MKRPKLTIHHRILAMALSIILLLSLSTGLIVWDSLDDILSQQLQKRGAEIAAHVALAGGVEHMSRHPMGEGMDPNPRFLAERLVDTDALIMGNTAENLHDRFPHLTKERADAYAMASQTKTAAAYEAGWIQPDLVPVATRSAELGWGRWSFCLSCLAHYVFQNLLYYQLYIFLSYFHDVTSLDFPIPAVLSSVSALL